MEPLVLFFILIPIGIGVGILAAITGLGGGVLMVPILTFGIFSFYQEPVLAILGLTVPETEILMVYATTISSTVIIFTGLSGTIAYSFQKRIDYVVGLISAVFTIGGAFLGKSTQVKSELAVAIFFAVLLLLTAIRMTYKVVASKREEQSVEPMSVPNPVESGDHEENQQPVQEPSRLALFLDKLILKRDITDNSGEHWAYNAKLYLTPFAFLGGFVAGMAGVGGGIVMVPVLHILIGLPMHFSVATSAFIMIFTKVSTLITAYTNPHIVTTGIWWPFVAGLAIGIIAGAQIGARLARRIKADPLKLIFAILLFAVAIWTIVGLFI
ncbi:MAG: TSUP family transporter [Candidatus Heimdallarchaeota archaeon]|nr:TSUP family transporter [Candidatus Heimdallarchaeota archaeon]